MVRASKGAYSTASSHAPGRISSLSAGAAVLIVAIFGASYPAAADDPETCRKADGPVSVNACTDAIASGKFQGRDLAALYLNRGFIASKLNDVDRAIQDYSEAIKTDPEYAVALNNRCAAYVRKRELDLAIQDCSKAVTLNANYVNAYVSRGNAYRQKGDSARALSDYERAIELDKNSVAALFGAALVYSSYENYGHALTTYDGIIGIDEKMLPRSTIGASFI